MQVAKNLPIALVMLHAAARVNRGRNLSRPISVYLVILHLGNAD